MGNRQSHNGLTRSHSVNIEDFYNTNGVRQQENNKGFGSSFSQIDHDSTFLRQYRPGLKIQKNVVQINDSNRAAMTFAEVSRSTSYNRKIFDGPPVRTQSMRERTVREVIEINLNEHDRQEEQSFASGIAKYLPNPSLGTAKQQTIKNSGITLGSVQNLPGKSVRKKSTYADKLPSYQCDSLPRRPLYSQWDKSHQKAQGDTMPKHSKPKYSFGQPRSDSGIPCSGGMGSDLKPGMLLHTHSNSSMLKGDNMVILSAEGDTARSAKPLGTAEADAQTPPPADSSGVSETYSTETESDTIGLGLQPMPNEVENIGLVLEKLKKCITVERNASSMAEDEYLRQKEELATLRNTLSEARSVGLQLEAANGRFIAESMKHKYLNAEIRQLTAELERRKCIFESKECEKRELYKEHERLMKLKLRSERQCQEALMESTLTSQQIHEVSQKCLSMEVFRDEECQLHNMMCNLQAALGRVRVLVTLKSTPHDSCIKYVSSTRLTFHPPVDVNVKSGKTNTQPILCEFSHIIQPGSCNVLELYNEISTTIDGVMNSLNACFVAVGPKNSGKTQTIFGEPCIRPGHSEIPRLKHLSTVRERKSYFEYLSTCNTPNFAEFSRSQEFASLYGLFGLSLVHLLQAVNLKQILDGTGDDIICGREYHMYTSIISVPLDTDQPEFDVLTNHPVKFTSSTLVNLKSNAPAAFDFELEQRPIRTTTDAIRVCELVHRRFQPVRWNGSRNECQRYAMGHNIAIITIEMQPQRDKNEEISTLVLVDTVGLDGESLDDIGTDTLETNRAIRTWKDIASLAQAMRTNPKPSLFDRTRILRILQPFILARTQPQTACTLLLHLPCDKSQARTAIQCLRLGLWVMQMDKKNGQNHGSNADDEDVQGAERLKQRCVWKIGTIGYPPKSSSLSSIPRVHLYRSCSLSAQSSSQRSNRRRTESIGGISRRASVV
ncbi:unnamed protein product [Calicophoron daubneyi]|uniref:Spindle pole body-associated protein Vik1/Cik1 microtubule binding domain-containing protein n=1 Tax=Calicophoron daubneyi TaxID=300641 RepID=A0AAV2TUW9_CALDB